MKPSHNARAFHLTLNRFLSADTIVPDADDPQSFNRYAYARNNPVKYIDPDGHCWGALSFVRDWNVETSWGTIGGGTNCANIDTALQLVQNPDVPVEDRILPATVVGGFGVATVYGTLGIVGLTCSAAAPCAKVVSKATGIGTAVSADGDPFNEAQALQSVIDRGFGGSQEMYRQFMQQLRSSLPSGTRVGIRGSSLTGESWKTGRAFDALGPGTSDLDLVLLGRRAMSLWNSKSFYIPQVNTMPLSDKMPDIAPALNPVRQALQQMAGRPVNMQAMPRWFLELRKIIYDQPYLIFPE